MRGSRGGESGLRSSFGGYEEPNNKHEDLQMMVILKG